MTRTNLLPSLQNKCTTRKSNPQACSLALCVGPGERHAIASASIRTNAVRKKGLECLVFACLLRTPRPPRGALARNDCRMNQLREIILACAGICVGQFADVLHTLQCVASRGCNAFLRIFCIEAAPKHPTDRLHWGCPKGMGRRWHNVGFAATRGYSRSICGYCRVRGLE
jgi:hypothetical protein